MANLVSLTIDADTRKVVSATGDLNRLGNAAKKTGDDLKRYEQGTRRATKETDRMSSAMNKLRGMVGLVSAGIAGIGFVSLAQQIERATTQMNNINATMRVAAGSANSAAMQIAFIREESQRLGLFFPTMAKQMAQFAAAARSSTMTSQELKDVFTGIAEASRAMGLTAPQAEGAMLALQQMMSKGKVSAEELRQQLGERMPGSIQIMANALDVTTSKLFDMMENGELLSDEVLPKFGRELSKVFSGQANLQADRIAASIQRLRTSFFDLMSQGDLQGAAMAINELAKVISSDDFQESFDSFVENAANLGVVFAENIDTIVSFGKALAGIGIGRVLSRLVPFVDQLTSLIGKIVPTTAATIGLVGAMQFLTRGLGALGGPAGLIISSAAGLLLFRDRTEQAKVEARNLNAEIQRLQQGFIDTSLASLEYQRSLAQPDFEKYLQMSEELASLQQQLEEKLNARSERGFFDITFGEDSVADLKEEIMLLKHRRSELEKNSIHFAELTRLLNERREELKEATEEEEDYSDALKSLAQLDPVFAATKKLREDLSDIDTVVERLGLSEQRAAELREDAYESYKKNVNDAVGSTNDLTKSYEELRAELDDGFSALVEYQETVKEIVDNVDDPEKVAELIGLAKEAYEEATKAAEDLGNQSTETTSQIEKDFERVADQVESEFSDAFYNIFEQGFGAFDDLADGILDIFRRTLADMAAAAIRQQIVIPITQQIVGGAGEILGAGGQILTGGGFGGASGIGGFSRLGSALINPGAGAGIARSFALSNVGESLGLSATAGKGGLSPGALGGGTGLTQSGSNLVDTAGAATSLAGIGGGFIGNQLGGGTMESNVGATAGQFIGAAIAGPVGAFLGGIGGGLLGGLFGSDPDESDANAFFQGGDRLKFTTSIFGGDVISGEQALEIQESLNKELAVYAKSLDEAVQNSFGEQLSKIIGTERVVGRKYNAFIEDYFGEEGKGFEAAIDKLVSLIFENLGEKIPGAVGAAVARIDTESENFSRQLLTITEVFRNASNLTIQYIKDFSNETELQGQAFVDQLRSFANSLQELRFRQELFLVDQITGGGTQPENVAAYLQTVKAIESVTQASRDSTDAYLDARNQIQQFSDTLGRSSNTAIRGAEDFERYITSLDLTSEAGREAAQAALEYAGAFSVLNDRLQRNLQRQRELENQLLSSFGRTGELVTQQFAGMTSENAALQIAVNLRQNLASAEQELANAQQDLVNIYQEQANVADGLAQTWKNLTDQLRQSADQLLNIGVTQSGGARSRFQQTLTRALGGDREAFEALPQLATNLSESQRAQAGTLADVRRANAAIAADLDKAADQAEQQYLAQLSEKEIAEKQLDKLTVQGITLEEAKNNVAQAEATLRAAQNANTQAVNKLQELLPNSIVNGLMEPLSPLQQIEASTQAMVSLLSQLGPGMIVGQQGQTASTPSVEQINRLFEEELGRAPEQEAIDWYSKQLADKGIEAVREDISGSAEAAVTDVFREILGRDPEQSAREFYGSQLEAGRSVEELRREVAASPEAQGFADGGIARGPMSGYTATLHGTEAVIPLNGKRIPLEVNNQDLVMELREVKQELANLRSEQEQSQYELVKYTKRNNRQFEQWDIDGLPETRTA